MGGGFGAGRGQKYIDVMGETKLQRSRGSLRRSQEGMLTLKDSVEITHIHGISMDSLPSCWHAKEAGDRVFYCVGWGSRAHMVSRADPSPCGNSAEHWEIWGCSWHFPAVLQRLCALSFPILPFLFPPSFHAAVLTTCVLRAHRVGVDAMLTLCKSNHLFPKPFFAQIESSIGQQRCFVWVFVYKGKMHTRKKTQ